MYYFSQEWDVYYQTTINDFKHASWNPTGGKLVVALSSKVRPNAHIFRFYTNTYMLLC